jgi:hypothetical protein
MKSILHCLRFVVLVILLSAKTFDVSGIPVSAIATGNWSATAWPNTARSGSITTSAASATVTGTGTSFLTQISVGNIIKTTGNVVIGTVLIVNSATSITLTANAASTNTAITYNTQGIGSGDAATIPGGFIVTVDKAGSACTTLGIGIGGTGNASLVFNSGTQLTASGVVTVGTAGHTGSIDMTSGGILISKGFTIANAGPWIPGTGTIELNGPNTIPTAFFAGVFNNLTISGATTTASNGLAIGGNLNIPDGGGGGSIFSTGFATTVTGTTTVGGQPSGSAFLIFSSATGAKTMNGLVTIGNGGTWDNSTGNSPVTFHGGINSSGSLFAGTGIQTFNTNDQTLSGTLIIPSVTVTGVTLTNNSVMTIATALDGTGTLAQGVNATLNVNFIGTPAISSMTATASGNLVNYGAAGAQTVFATDYYYLTLSNSGVKTLQTTTTNIAADFRISGTASTTGVADLTVGGNLLTTINASIDSGPFTYTISGNLNNAGSFTAPTGSVVNVGLDVNNTGTFNTGPNTVANITGSVFNVGTFNGGAASFLYIGGNANNSGTLNAGTNTIVFNGSALQTLTNTGAGAANNITINNVSDGLQLETDITVPNILDMTLGNIDLNGNNLHIGVSTFAVGTLLHTSGTIIGVGTIQRWYNTTAISDGSQSGLYPVGTVADYRPFFVSTATGPTGGGSLTLNYNDASGTTAVSIPDGSSTIETLDNLNWNLLPGDGLSGGTYNLRVEGTGFGTVLDVNDLRISLAASVVGTAGTNAGTTTNPQVNRTGLTDAELANTFFFGFSSSTPLPITLLYFKAYPVNDEVKLDWETTAEFNNDHFTILRSTNTSVWEIVTVISGSGNSSVDQKYTTVDAHPYSGISYYKLQQTDRDGKTSFSHVVSVSIDQTAIIRVNPNPATDQIFITTPGPGKLEYQLYNSAGRIMMVTSEASPNSVRLSISDLPAGTYYINTIFNGVKLTKTIIKN